MKGLRLDLLKGDLHKVAPKHNENPARSIPDVDEKLLPFIEYIHRLYPQFSLEENAHSLPFRVFRHFTFDEICKLNISSKIEMDRSVTDLFETRPNYELIRKLKSSMWRWGAGTAKWNDIVDLYNGLRTIDLGLPPEFEVRLDFSRYNKSGGRSKYSNTYLDGVFALLVYHEKRHVLTIGFSVMANRRILIQQVQLVQPKGNRWLYQLPRPRVELVIDAFARAFPNFDLYMVDGESLAKRSLENYEYSCSRLTRFIASCEASKAELYSESYVESQRQLLASVKTKIAHLEADTPRLVDFYANCGRHRLGRKLQVNGLFHRKLTLCS